MKDFLGQELSPDDYVSGLFSSNESPGIFQVKAFTPKKVSLIPVEDASRKCLKYPKDLLKLDPDVVSKILYVNPKDALGQDLAVGDYVFGSGGEYIDPVIFEITGFAPRVAMVKSVYNTNRWGCREGDRLTSDLIKVDPRLVTMHILMHRLTKED